MVVVPAGNAEVSNGKFANRSLVFAATFGATMCVGIFIALGQEGSPVTRGGALVEKYPRSTIDDLGVRGSPNAAIVVVEYSDFRCLYCAKSSQILAELENLYSGQVRTVFKHLPYVYDARSLLAHKAALAAGEQGRFWEMHDLLFANRRFLERQYLIQYARQLNLDMGRFVSGLDGGKFAAIVDRDREEAKRHGVTATPTFFINDRKLVGARPLTEFATLIERELKRERVRAHSAEQLADRSDGIAAAGPADAPVVVGLFADFQSPLSAKATVLARRLAAFYPRELRLLFKNFPLAFHKQAKLAHQAALAAGAQGKFWQMHDRLFGSQGRFRGWSGGGAGRFRVSIDRNRASRVFRRIVGSIPCDGARSR